MKIIVLQENLQKALNIVGKISTTSGQLPILSTVLIKADKEGIVLSTTNLELSINYWVGGKVEKEGRAVVPAKEFLEGVNTLSKDKVEISSEEGKINMQCRSSKMTFNTLNVSDFPIINSLKKEKKTFKVPSEEFKKAVERVSFSSALEESRAVLTGVIFKNTKEGMEMAATDGYRLSKCQLKKVTAEGMDEGGVIIPSKALNELIRLISPEDKEIGVSLQKKENQIVFELETAELIARTIEGEFPDYNKIIPEEIGKGTAVNRDEFERAVKMASIFARDAGNIVRISLQKGSLIVEANARELGKGQSSISIEGEEEEMKIAFNFRFINEFLKAAEGEEIYFWFKDEQKPGIFWENDKDKFIHLVMPVKVQEQ